MGDIAVPAYLEAGWPPSLVEAGPLPRASSVQMRQRSDNMREAAQNGEQASVEEDEKAKKKKRVQFTSCDACRLRKVRCIRSADHLECVSCISKNIACTRVFSTSHAHGKGKRIKQAREQFGTKMEQFENTDTFSAISKFTSLAVQSGPAYKLNEHILSAKALSAFLHAYETDVASAIPALEYPRLLKACQEVAFDISRLDELDRVLCIAAAGVAASVQQADRKFGASQSAITIKEPLAIKKDLESRVMEEADRLGVLRKPSPRTLEILRLFCILTSGEACRQLRRSDSYRAYEQALVEHMRNLSEGGQISEQKVAEHFWSIILGDSFACAVSGRSPSFTSDDIQNFASYVDYSTEGMLLIIGHMDYSSPDAGFGLIFASICQLCRAFYHRVTSVKARKRPFLDLAMLQEISPEMDRINQVMDVCEQKLDSMFGKNAWPDKLGYWARVVRFLHTFILIMALDELENAIVKELSRSISLQRLQSLQETMETLQLRTMAELDANMGWEPKPGLPRILATVDGLMAFVSVLRMRRILKLQAIEEGGSPGSWNMSSKLANANYYMKVCEYLGCAVSEVAEELPSLRCEMVKLEQRAKAFKEQQPALHLSTYTYQEAASANPVVGSDSVPTAIHLATDMTCGSVDVATALSGHAVHLDSFDLACAESTRFIQDCPTHYGKPADCNIALEQFPHTSELRT